jgi:acetyl-CoA carboxylase biotin carboxyl carrier protein
MASRGKPRAEDRRPEPADAGPPFVAIARGLAEIVTEHNLSELILDTKELTLTVRRGGAVAAPVHVAPAVALPVASGPAAAPAGSAAAAPAEPAASENHHVVTSPFVGTFYRRPNPDSPNYVSLHDKVDKGQVLCIVEAMKLMNEIEADVAGTIVGILVEDGAPVEYGQPLFKIAQ